MKNCVIPACFDLEQTLDCGQAFRWRKISSEPEEWEGVAFGKILRLQRAEKSFYLSCSQEDLHTVWNAYFDLETDYGAIRKTLAAFNPALGEAIRFAPGIRILRQEPWETLCSFLISQNNHIPRIKGIIERLCALLGQPLAKSGLFSFPSPEAFSGLSTDDLAPLAAGYRAKYLIDAARKVLNGEVDLQKIAGGPVEKGREALQKIQGVGPKVAECVLLYGFHKMECFPMDVWMKRAMSALLPGVSPEDLGENAGIAQQYLFHYSRMHPSLVNKSQTR